MSTRSELSGVATALEEMERRIAAIAADLAGAEREELSADLFEVERALGAAARRLGRALADRR